jgi:uncharacterized membrane protein
MPLPHRQQPAMATEPAAQLAQRVHVRDIDYERPLVWLAKGWRDMLERPGPALAHGVLVAGFGLALLALAHRQFWLLAGAFSGFLLVGPIAATGLYAVARALERGQQPTLATALTAWRPKDHRLVLFGLLMCAAGTGWVLTSASLIQAFAPAAVADPVDFLRVVVLDDEGWLFEGWLALGGALVAPVYASSVVAIPLLMERRIGVLAAVLVSWHAVLHNVGPMTLWGALLLAITFVGMSTAMLGLVVAVPWLAYASWHAYRDLVDAGALQATD